MKPFPPGLWQKLFLLVSLGSGPATALDRLPSPGCRDRSNLILLHQCNPYAVKLIYVTEDQLLHNRSRTPSFGRKLSAVPGPSYRRRLTLQQLVEHYIRYEERLQSLRPRTPTPLPPPHRPVTHPTPSPKPAKKREANATKAAPTLAEALGERNVTAMLMQPPSHTEEERFLKVTKPRATLSVPEEEKLPETIVHRVKAGENLIGLARRYKTSSYDIRRWNHLKRDHFLRVGEELTIHPGVKSTPEEIREGLLRETYGFYRVKKGDTLLGLARRFGVKSAEIRRLNRLSSGHLRIGQKLMLPLTPKKIAQILEREKGYRFKYTGDLRFKHRLRVVATAYTSHRGQTDRTPFLAAWNNRIRPGMKIIAVSPDLIRKYGITNGTRVKISGLRGVYTVRDKMNPRLRNHIDIYMGIDRRRALRWGRRRVMLYW
jgi:LysM repeat protein